MPPKAVNILFTFLHAFGIVFFCAGLFLYEDEEQKFQNRIEQWWIKLDDKQKESRSRVASFMQEIARLTGKGFDKVFGPRLFSLRMIPISIFLSFASFLLLVLLMFPWLKQRPPTSPYGVFLFFVCFLALALVPALVENKWLLAIWWAIIPFNIISSERLIAFVFRTRGPRFGFQRQRPFHSHRRSQVRLGKLR